MTPITLPATTPATLDPRQIDSLDNPIERALLIARYNTPDVSDVHIRQDDVPWFTVLSNNQRRPDLPVITSDDITAFFQSAFPPPLQEECRNVSEENNGRGHATISLHTGPYAPVRVHCYHELSGYGFCIRLLSKTVPELASLNLPHTIADFANVPSGLILFVGATGAGKSTAVAALIQEINKTRAERIITIEDPIEYLFASQKSLITQHAVGEHMPSYFEGFRSALRSAPTTIFVGEMRDPETMRQAIRAAQSGHRVFSTLHTGSATETIDRILGSFDAKEADAMRAYFAYVLHAVVALRLPTRADGTARIPATEVLIATQAVREHIANGTTKQLYNAITSGRALGMHTLEHNLSELVHAGVIDIGEARRIANKPDELK